MNEKHSKHAQPTPGPGAYHTEKSDFDIKKNAASTAAFK
jgi:hypothetical protein